MSNPNATTLLYMLRGDALFGKPTRYEEIDGALLPGPRLSPGVLAVSDGGSVELRTRTGEDYELSEETDAGKFVRAIQTDERVPIIVLARGQNRRLTLAVAEERQSGGVTER